MNDRTCDETEPWYSGDAGGYSPYIARARRLQAEAFGSAMVAVGRYLARIGAKCTHRIREAIRKRRTIAELSRLEDYMLADIGIDRAQIPMIAQELIAPSGEVPRRTSSTAVRPTEYRGEAANDPSHGSIAA